MNKLIKLSELHYIIVDDSEIKENTYYVNNGVIFLSDSVYNEGNNPNNSNPRVTDYNFKITHSTQTLSNVETISLSEVEEVINGYSVEKMSTKFASKEINDGCDSYHDLHYGYIQGFKAHQELVKDKLFTSKDLVKAYYNGAADCHDKCTVRNWKGVEEKVDLNNLKILCKNYIQSLLPKTEWDIEIQEGKIKLI